MAKDVGRNWATIIYLDSAPDDWIDILASLHCEIFASPLHDKDVWTVKDEEDNPAHKAGELKKAHIHLLFMFEGNKTLATMKEMVKLVNGVGCVKVESLRVYARYLCHLDEFDKPVYSFDKVLEFGGADYDKVSNSAKDRYTCFKEMICYVYDNNIRSYHQLITFAMWHNHDWFKCLCDGGSFTMRSFIQDYACNGLNFPVENV